MKLLVLSFYYEPDLSAGSFRTVALVKAMRERSSSDVLIDVLTTLPNRYDTFSAAAAELEVHEGLTIRRVAVPYHRSDMLGQSWAFLSFARQVLKHTARRDYDIVFATSSRLMTAALGAWISRRRQAALYLDIRDIFVDTIKELLPWIIAQPLRWVFSWLEAWTMRGADRINLVSPGFKGYFLARYGERSFSYFTNGIDDEFLAIESQLACHESKSDRTTIVYAGNIGDGQGLHQILPELAMALRDRARFIVIGAGRRRQALETAVAQAGIDNVELRAPLLRNELIAEYCAADVLFMHLGAHRAFEKVLPSKIFEYAAVGKPILAGVAGFAEKFVRREISNAAVFPPCDAVAAVNAFDLLELVDRARPDFVAKYSRTTISQAMADDVFSLADNCS